MEAFIGEWLRSHHAQRAHPFDLPALRAALLDHLESRGLRIEDFTECEYMSFALDERGGQWTLVIHDYDDRTGPYQRSLVFAGQEQARQAVLDIVLPVMRNYRDLADVAWPA